MSAAANFTGRTCVAAALLTVISCRPTGPVPHWPAMAGANLLLVTIDTLRADRLTDRNMPGLSALGRAGQVFPTTYAHAPLTLPSHASLLTGLMPPAHGVRGNGGFRLAEAHTTLAERLRTAGYRTGAFVAAFVLDSRFGLAQGFDRYDGVDDDRPFAADFAYAERRAPAVLAGAEAWIGRDVAATRPWFTWVHLFDPHGPYDAPDSSGVAPYDGEVRYVDRELTRFLDRLRSQGALARTLVVVTADHGESLGQHGEATHGLFAYDATMHVPLIMAGPGWGTGRAHRAPAAHIDVVPTILDTLGLPVDVGLPGRSLRVDGADEPRPIYLESQDGWLTAGAAPLTAVVEGGLKFIALPEPELYDLTVDPGESRNLLPASADRARPLAAALRTMTANTAATGATPPDREAEARLRSLGYASVGPRAIPSAFGPNDDPKVVRPMYEHFLTLLSAGAPDVGALRALVEARPSFEAARLAAASLLIDQGRAPDAVNLLEPAAAAPGASLAVRERLGAALLGASRFDRAVGALTTVVEDGQASADAWNALGVGLAALGRHREAVAALNQAILLAPSAARMRFNRALAHLADGDRAAARRDASDAAVAQPSFVDAWRLRATLDHEAGDKAAAIEAWQRVIALESRDLDTRFNLAVTLRDVGRLDEARVIARSFAELAPRPDFNREIALLAPLLERR